MDDEYDSAYQFSLDGTQSRSIDKAADLILAAIIEQAKANNGQLSRNPAELTPYLARPIEPSKIQRLLAEIPASIVTVDQLNAAKNSR